MGTPKPSLQFRVRMEKIECSRCMKTFSQTSSLLRHIRNKRCEQSSVVVRQKSCQRCSESKTKCDLRRPTCHRCAQRNFVCGYPSMAGSTDSPDSRTLGHTRISNSMIGLHKTHISTEVEPSTELSNETPLTSNQRSCTYAPLEASPYETSFNTLSTASEGLDDFCASLTASVNTTSESLLPLDLSSLPSISTTPPLTRHSMQTILRCLRTWPRIMAKGLSSPPIIHPSVLSQPLMPAALARCFTLVKMWDGQCTGANTMVEETVKKEMQCLLDIYQTLSEDALVAALQAMVIYTILLVFPRKTQSSVSLLPEALFRSLRDVVFYAAATGLMLPEETTCERPDWKSWINITSKRRSVFALYLIHWAYSVHHSLPSYDCRDLGMMPAPAAKYLWQTESQEQWEKLYLKWLVMWDGRQYMQWEYFTIGPGVALDKRAELWLEDADEYGIMFMSIVNATDREPRFQADHL